MNHFQCSHRTREILKCGTAVGLAICALCHTPITIQDNVKPLQVVQAANTEAQSKMYPDTVNAIAGSAVFESGVVVEATNDTSDQMETSVGGFELTLDDIEQRSDFTPATEITTESTPYTEPSIASNGVAHTGNPAPGELNSTNGSVTGPSGKETYYNLPMDGVIRIMRQRGYSEEEYPYWVRSDGVKMFGDYVMVAASLDIRPKGTILECSKGTAIVVDTGDFANTNKTQLDIAVTW